MFTGPAVPLEKDLLVGPSAALMAIRHSEVWLMARKKGATRKRRGHSFAERSIKKKRSQSREHKQIFRKHDQKMSAKVLRRSSVGVSRAVNFKKGSLD